jgi:hypothetical protein
MTDPLRRLLDRLDEIVTRRADARAHAMGLTVERIPGTRIHLYSRGGRGYAYRPTALSAPERGES